MSDPLPGREYKVFYDEFKDGRPWTNYVQGRIVEGNLEGGPVTVIQTKTGNRITLLRPTKFETEGDTQLPRDPTEGRRDPTWTKPAP